MIAPTLPTSVFGSVHLGYLVIETEHFSDWRRFGQDAIGMHLDHLLTDTMRFRLDDHACRFLLHRGPAEDVIAVGWELDDDATFDTIIGRVHAQGVPIREGAREEAQLRGVERFISFPGPNGLTQEIFTRAHTDATPLQMRTQHGFVTGEDGMGHVAVISKRPHQMRAYYDTVFDARLSDFIDETISGLKVKIRFLRVNRRHHSLAIAALNRLPINPVRTRVQHLNIQAAELTDMTAAYERTRALGFPITMDVGQHTNDKELSFYAATPSGFEWEVGWNPIVVDEALWRPTTHQGISIWGHGTPQPTLAGQMAQIRTASRSVLHGEESVDALSGRGIPDERIV